MNFWFEYSADFRIFGPITSLFMRETRVLLAKIIDSKKATLIDISFSFHLYHAFWLMFYVDLHQQRMGKLRER